LKRFLILFLLLVFTAVFVFAYDFGGLLGGHFTAEDESASGKITLSPWLAMPLGEDDLYISAGLNVNIKDNVTVVPELFRLEYSTRIGDSITLRAGRIPWQDASRFTARGRFDGAEMFYNLGSMRFGAAVLYSGLLYKDSAGISVSPGDEHDYNQEFDWENFADTYFAPKRMLMSLHSEMHGFPFQRGNLYAGLMAQFDLGDESFNTQYLLLRYTFIFNQFDLFAAGAAGLENTDGIRAAFAYTLEGGMQLPTPIRDRLSVGFRWASGEGPSTAAFFPISSEAQGVVIKPVLSGMSIVRLNYEVRLLSSLAAEFGMKYFIRTDSVTFNDSELTDDSYSLGAEVSGNLLWVPFSDLSMTMTGGVFLPQTGGAMESDAKPRLFLTVGTLFSF